MNFIYIFNLDFTWFNLRVIFLNFNFFRTSEISKKINLNNIRPSWFSRIPFTNFQNSLDNLLLLYNWDFVSNLISWRFSVTVKIVVDFIIFVGSNWLIRFIHVSDSFSFHFLTFFLFLFLFFFFRIINIEDFFWFLILSRLWKIIIYISYLNIKPFQIFSLKI